MSDNGIMTTKNGETSIEVRNVEETWFGWRAVIPGDGVIKEFSNEWWNFTRTLPPLPTEPGLYIVGDTDGSTDSLDNYVIFSLDSDSGDWEAYNYSGPIDAEGYARDLVRAWGPLRKLIIEEKL